MPRRKPPSRAAAPSPLEALLLNAKQNPEEDTPRLILADWLEEQGEADRAEFIRLQCKSARRPEWDLWPRSPSEPDHYGGWDEGALEREKRAGELLARHRHLWLGPWLDHGTFWRGLVQVTLDPTTLAHRRDEWASVPHWPWVEGLKLQCPEDRRCLRLLEAVLPLVGGFTSLNLEYSQIGLGGASSTARDARFSRDPGGRLSARGVKNTGDFSISEQISRSRTRLLASSPHLSGLLSLNLDGVGLRGEGVRELAASPHLRGLRYLSLSGNHIGEKGATALAQSLNLRSLAVLDLDLTDLPDRAIQALADSTHFQDLRSLKLRSIVLETDAVRALGASPWAAQLIALDLSGSRMLDAGVQELAAAPRLGNLRWLDLSGAGAGPVGVRALAASPNVARLIALDLSWNRIGEEGAVALATSASLAGLRYLDLSGCRIGDRGAVALANSPHLRNLAELHVYATDASEGGSAALAQSFGESFSLCSPTSTVSVIPVG